MEKTTSQKMKLGAFVLLGLFLFVIAVYFIGNKQKLFGNTNELYAVFNNVNGLELGNNVRYSGINVGTVHDIEMINDTTIKVKMIIDKDIFHHIKKNAKATITSDGLVGNMIINILPGKFSKNSVEPGDVIASTNRIRTDDILKTLNATNKNAAKLSEDLLKITKEILEGNGTIGVLLKDSIMANDLKETINSLKLTGKETSASVVELHDLIKSMNKKNSLIGVLKDSAVAKQIRNVINNFEKTSLETDKAVGNLNKTILNVKEGKGALNYLANDPNLVRKIDSTMTNLHKASLLLNENLEAMKHNFLTKGYFKDKEKQKKKASKK